MVIGILQDKNIQKGHETLDVCLTPQAASVLIKDNHSILIEGIAGDGYLKNYLNIGAYIINTKQELLDRAGLIIKKTLPQINDLNYINGEDKIIFTQMTFTLNKKEEKLFLQKIIEKGVTLINYLELTDKKKAGLMSKTEFSHYVLPFLLELSKHGLKALLDDEILRLGLVVMAGKVYNPKLAAILKVHCYEF
jgi:alanine dehydrogenase